MHYRQMHCQSLSVIIIVALLCAASVVRASIEECTPAECDCQLPNVRSEGRSFTKTIGTKMCICICGSDLAQECKSDGQCVPGAYCKFEYSTADASFANSGKCTSQCDRQKCPQFHECRIGVTGAATCECSVYPCDDSVVVPICAAAPDDRAIQRFNNTCLFVNESCNRKQKGLTELKSFVCMSS